MTSPIGLMVFTVIVIVCRAEHFSVITTAAHS